MAAKFSEANPMVAATAAAGGGFSSSRKLWRVRGYNKGLAMAGAANRGEALAHSPALQGVVAARTFWQLRTYLEWASNQEGL